MSRSVVAELLAELARGSTISASREYPFPHEYVLVHGDAVLLSLEEAQVQRLVDRKLIAGKPQDPLWDTIDFHVERADQVKRDALEHWKHGFGWCATCGALLCRTEKDVAPRHGFTQGDAKTPPCTGSGQPMVHVVKPGWAEVTHA
jgi:hypothetical protein